MDTLFFRSAHRSGDSENSKAETEESEGGSMSTAFFIKMQPYAMKASQKTGIPSQVILSQWAHESNYGNSDLAKRAKNFAGIKYTSNADFKSGMYGGYHSLNSFANDYARVMGLSYYKDVREAGTVDGAIKELGKSPYAEDKSYAEKLRKVLESNGGKIEGGSSSGGSGFFTSPLFIGLIAILVILR